MIGSKKDSQGDVNRLQVFGTGGGRHKGGSGPDLKSVDFVDPENYDKIISMGCGVSCPALPIDEDWGLEDPFGREIEAYRITRDEIRARVNAIVDRGTDA